MNQLVGYGEGSLPKITRPVLFWQAEAYPVGKHIPYPRVNPSQRVNKVYWYGLAAMVMVMVGEGERELAVESPHTHQSVIP